MMTENKVFFSFGALSDDFSAQLKQQGYELKKTKKNGTRLCFQQCIYTYTIF